MQAALAAWRERVPDWSDQPESEMAEQLWPGDVQPVTVDPVISAESGLVTIESGTPGASIGYRVNGTPWQVYSGAFEAAPGDEIESKAIRYGWRESGVSLYAVRP